MSENTINAGLRRLGYELSDFEWSIIEPLLPNKPRGVPRVDDRRVLNGIYWRLRTGSPWADIPERYPRPVTLLFFTTSQDRRKGRRLPFASRPQARRVPSLEITIQARSESGESRTAVRRSRVLTADFRLADIACLRLRGRLGAFDA